ncbi:MAG: AAA domain-containing protein [bacterium]|nr:AAA domain-containing protein [bacterium]
MSDNNSADDSGASGKTSAKTKQTLIQPCGVSGRPVKWVPEKKHNIRLEHHYSFGEDGRTTDSGPELAFSEAVGKYIEEQKKQRSGSSKIILENGKKVTQEFKISSSGFTYEFPIDDEMATIEGTPLDATVDGQSASGQLAWLLKQRIAIELNKDFGPEIKQCHLRIDNCALLQSLKQRLDEVANKTLQQPFNKNLAQLALTNSGKELPTATFNRLEQYTGSKPLNSRQREAVEKALANNLTYIWGPPGTGKTEVLSTLVRILHDQGKRILVCSNTNQAVDQVILKLCRGLNTVVEGRPAEALTQNSIIRAGRIHHEELRLEFGGFVTVEGALEQRQKVFEKEIESLNLLIAGAEETKMVNAGILRQFAELGTLKLASSKLSAQLLEHEKNAATGKKTLRGLQRKLQTLTEEQNKVKSAKGWRKFLYRSQSNIDSLKAVYEQRLNHSAALVDNIRNTSSNIKTEFVASKEKVVELEAALSGISKQGIAASEKKLDCEIIAANTRLTEIRQAVTGKSGEIVKKARVVGATVTRTYLSYQELGQFDVVIVDEASMVLLPALYFVGGLAGEKLLISGDFRQLSPILQTDETELYQCLGQNIFAAAGIAHLIDAGEKSVKRLVQLNEQFRMDSGICDLISGRIYGGLLKTSADRQSDFRAAPDSLIRQSLTIIDTSEIGPICGKDRNKSKYNLVHAAVIQAVISRLHDCGALQAEGALGVVTPYAAQARLLRKMLQSSNLGDVVQAGTVHSYQGDEKQTIVIDIPDSFPLGQAGMFLQSDSPDEDGTRLFNVAITRAKEQLVFIANLQWLEKKLSSQSTLRYLLAQAQSTAEIIDARQLISSLALASADIGEVADNLASDRSRRIFANAQSFDRLADIDIINAKRSIEIISAFVTPRRVRRYVELFRRKVNEGVKVTCIVPSADKNGTIDPRLGREALEMLESCGCELLLSRDKHQKALIIDNCISWVGSMNVLSSNLSQGEFMLRLEGADCVTFLGQTLLGDMQSIDTSENMPRICPKCQGPMILRQNKSSEKSFYGCTSYPKCDGTRPADSGAIED